MLRHAGSDMGMMMLDLVQGQIALGCQLLSQLRGKIIRVQVHDNVRRVPVEQLSITGESAAVIALYLRVFQVSHMLGNDCLTPGQQAESVLQFRPHGQDRFRTCKITVQDNGFRRIAPGTPDHARFAIHDPQHRIVQPVDDVPVMHQPEIGYPGKPLQSPVIVDVLRFVRPIPRGQDDGFLDILQQTMVQRCIGQQHSQIGIVWGDAAGQVFPLGLENDDRRGPAFQQALFLVVGKGILAQHAHVLDHDRKGFVIAVLALAQTGNGLFVAGIAGKMKTANALDGNNSPLGEQPRSGGYGIHIIRLQGSTGSLAVDQG